METKIYKTTNHSKVSETISKIAELWSDMGNHQMALTQFQKVQSKKNLKINLWIDRTTKSKSKLKQAKWSRRIELPDYLTESINTPLFLQIYTSLSHLSSNITLKLLYKRI